jgi:hypothetical protein
MECLGIDRNEGIVYEGRLSQGFRTNPSPFLAPCAFVGEQHQELVLADTFKTDVEGYPPLLFREDSFEPVTKVRRGRVFRLRNCKQPNQWHVQDPLRTDLECVSGMGSQGQFTWAFFYERADLGPIAAHANSSAKIFLTVGSEPFLTLWEVVGIERSVHGTPLVSLRARRFLDALPELRPDGPPAQIMGDLKLALQHVENCRNRLGAGDLVDRCRAAMSVIFGQLCGDRTLDLSAGVSRFDKDNPGQHRLICWAGQIVARLHSRVKPNEAHKYQTRVISESDAELAVSCVGLVLRDLGWTKPE